MPLSRRRPTMLGPDMSVLSFQPTYPPIETSYALSVGALLVLLGLALVPNAHLPYRVWDQLREGLRVSEKRFD
ncbi:hypothetical protein K466DRAFT_592742 [Polyporus arcularius HHB13444]|uniref:Uncharacterized protein n=1 Tax=Polyporus arcularius HHB13444 TaxID=1314778 RepID=A0A5C3NQL2_9APHY|nr:hypothetical protein K466DRAFT_592742 [Polyporus arcularius HHB13444]